MAILPYLDQMAVNYKHSKFVDACGAMCSRIRYLQIFGLFLPYSVAMEIVEKDLTWFYNIGPRVA